MKLNRKLTTIKKSTKSKREAQNAKVIQRDRIGSVEINLAPQDLQDQFNMNNSEEKKDLNTNTGVP